VPRDFLKLWAGQSISLLGSEVTLLAMPLVAVLVLGASPVEMGFLRAVQFVPELFALSLGPMVDRRRRRPLLIGADLAHALVLASVPVAAMFGVLSMPQMYVVAVLSGALTVVFAIAYQTYLPHLVASSYLLQANARLSISRSAAHAAGPAVAGQLVQVLSAPAALLFDALSFAASAVCVFWIRSVEALPSQGERQRLWVEIVDGLQVLVKQPVLRAITLSGATWNFFSGGVLDALYVLYLSREMRLQPAEIAALFTVSGILGVVGSLLSGRASRVFGLGWTTLGGAALGPLGTLIVPFVDPNATERLWLLGLVSFSVGFAQPLFSIGFATLGQAFSPPDMLGRINASRRFLLIGVVPIAALLGGALGETIGPRSALLVAGLGLLLTPVWLFFSPVRRLRVLE
jgi:MFS family permease